MYDVNFALSVCGYVRGYIIITLTLIASTAVIVHLKPVFVMLSNQNMIQLKLKSYNKTNVLRCTPTRMSKWIKSEITVQFKSY